MSRGSYSNEEAAAHASETLAKTLMANGERGHKLNFTEESERNEAAKRQSSDDHVPYSFNRLSYACFEKTK